MEPTAKSQREMNHETSVKLTPRAGAQAASNSRPGTFWLSMAALVLAAAAIGYSAYDMMRSTDMVQLELRTVQLEREFADLALAARGIGNKDELIAAIKQVTADKEALAKQINAFGETMEQVNRLVLSRTDPAVISKITQTLEMILDDLTSVEQRQDQLNEEQEIIMERMEAITASMAAPAPSSIMTTGNAANGTWVINLASARTQREAEDFLKQIEALGHAAELHSVKINGRDWIRVRIVGLPNRSVARALLDEVQRHHPFKTAWMDRQ